MLKAARQASGMHIAALAVALKVPVSKLEALEADNYAVLPDTVFVRALASSICRTLKVDPAPILALLPQSKSPHLKADTAGLNAPVKGHGGRASTSFASSSSFTASTSRSVTVVVLALLAGALALVYFPRSSDGLASDPSFSPGVGPQAPVAGGDVSPVGVVAAPLSNQVAPDSVGAGDPSVAAASEALSTVASTTAPAPVVSASEAASTIAPSGVLLIRARSESWVQVKDSAGAVVLQRNLAATETVSVSGAVPMSVVIGRADATEVFVRGKPFELGAVSRENVARFEVK
ncbi:MAG: helix-turn-helix domain-containing protein [Acidovorax sp.]|uniref:helix-turn-helix domain-containing protein n=1 Tax=Acidovorax sp. TaxID=1872122 RepID=UPI003919ED14